MNGSNYFSSVTGRAALQRFHFPIVNELFPVHILQMFRFGGVGAPLPVEFRDFIRRADGGGGIAMAIQAETHAQGFGMAHFIHLIHAAMTFQTAKTASDVDGMVEINVVRHDMNLHPRDRRVVRRAVADDGQAGVVLQNLVVAIHARRSAGEIREPGFFHAIMTIAAIKPHLAGMNLVRKRHRLHGLVTRTGVFGREINRHARRHATAG